MTQLVAFLRGINLGNRRIKMDNLRTAFADMGFEGAHTLIASGNVLFEADMSDGLATKIEAGLQKSFGFQVGVVLRAIDDLKKLIADDPFNGQNSDDNTKLYIFMLADDIADKIDLPKSVEGDFELVGATSHDIFAKAYRTPSGRFGPGLDLLSKPFNRKTVITNRNWNTIQRLVEKAGKGDK